jgi:conjugative transposon TraM protein
MEKKVGTSSQMDLRKRKMLLLLPVILIPLLTLGFYGLGGGAGTERAKPITSTKGLNLRLPEARFDAVKKNMNKLGLYQQSDEDSVRLRERRKQDPYYEWKDPSAGSTISAGRVTGKSPADKWAPLSRTADTQATEFLRRLDHLKGMLSNRKPAEVPHETSELPVIAAPSYPAIKRSEGDPDLDKLNSLMEKVLKLRYGKQSAPQDTVSSVRVGGAAGVLSLAERKEEVTTLAEEPEDGLETGFIYLDDRATNDSVAEQMIVAAVDRGQTVVSGEEVTFRTIDVGRLGGIAVPKGTLLSGKANLSGERLLVTNSSARIGNRVLPVALDVVDLDGVAGIHVKGSIDRDVAKESAGEAIGTVGVMSADPGITGQATAAGMQAAKNLLSRKMRLVRVGLPAGYRVLLQNKGVNRK